MSIGDWARLARELGLDAIDLSIDFFRGKKTSFTAEVRKEIESAGMKIAIVNTYTDFTHPEKSERRKQFDQFKQDLYAAIEVGAKIVRITAGQAYPEISREQGVNWVLDGFYKAADISKNADIKIVFENHSKPGNWKFADFCLPTDIFLEVAEGIKNTTIGLLFDTANPVVYGDDPLVLLGKILERVECVHIADTAQKGALKPVVIGTGKVPFKEIFNVLKSSSFDGWFSIEEASCSGYEGIKKAVEFVEIYR
jgi:sugar phosphate isomerase/epimerase